MRSLDNRLKVVRKRLRIPEHSPKGAYEHHFLQAFPECLETPGCELVPCELHGGRCGVQSFPIDAPIIRRIIMDCAWRGGLG